MVLPVVTQLLHHSFLRQVGVGASGCWYACSACRMLAHCVTKEAGVGWQ
jgi:hypothetical protein